MSFTGPYHSRSSNAPSPRWPHQGRQKPPTVHRHYDLENVAVSKWIDPYKSTLPQYAIGRRATGKRVIKRITADGEQSSDSEDDEGEGGQEKNEGESTAVPSELEQYLVPIEDCTRAGSAKPAAAKILDLSKEPQESPPAPTPRAAGIVVALISSTEEVILLPEAPEPPDNTTDIPQRIADALADGPLDQIPKVPTADVKSVAPPPDDTKPASMRSAKKVSEPVGSAEKKAVVEQGIQVMREEDLEGDDFVIVDEGKKEKKRKKHKAAELMEMAQNGIAEQGEPRVAIVGEVIEEEKTTEPLPERTEPTKPPPPPPPPLPLSSTVTDAKRPGSSRQRRSSHGTAGWTRPSRRRRNSEASTKEKSRSPRKNNSSRKGSLLEESKERSERNSRTSSRANDVKSAEAIRKGSEKSFIVEDGRQKGRRKSSGSSRGHVNHQSHGSDSRDNEGRRDNRPRQRNRVIAKSAGGSFFGLLRRALTG